MRAYRHQQDAVVRARDGNLALFHDCGTGKTFTALQLIKKYRKEGPALVLCPKNLIYDAWIDDCKTFTPDLDIISVHDNDTEKRNKILRQDHEVYVTTPDTFKNMFTQIADRGFKTLVVDESSNMKSYSSQTTRAILTLAGFNFRRYKGVRFPSTKKPIPHRFPLTATPAPNTPLEYWGQAKLVTGPGDDIFPDNPFTFRAIYFNPIDYGENRKGWVFKRQMFEQFCDILAKTCHVTRKQDVLDLPPQINQVHRVDLSAKERLAYKQMERDLVLLWA